MRWNQTQDSSKRTHPIPTAPRQEHNTFLLGQRSQQEQQKEEKEDEQELENHAFLCHAPQRLCSSFWLFSVPQWETQLKSQRSLRSLNCKTLKSKAYKMYPMQMVRLLAFCYMFALSLKFLGTYFCCSFSLSLKLLICKHDFVRFVARDNESDNSEELNTEDLESEIY